MLQKDKSKYPFTEEDVNNIIRMDKYIDGTFLQDDPPNSFEDTVYVGSDREDIGLVFSIRPERRTIGVALKLRNERIRGINNVTHHRPDCKILKGWHEHIWKIPYRDKWAESLIPRKELSTPKGIVKFALKRWNIKTFGVFGEQLELRGNK